MMFATEIVMHMKPEAREKIAASVLSQQLGQPEEVVAVVEFILKNDYINGRCVDVDGALRL